MKNYRIGFITSQPIVDQAPLFQKLAAHQSIDLMVYFCLNVGVNKPEFDKQFNKAIQWDIPILSGYKYKFLKNFSPKSSSSFWGQVNPGIILELLKNRRDALIIHGWNSFSNILAFLSAVIIRTPVLLRSESPLNQELLKSRWRLFVGKLLFGAYFKLFTGFLYIGEENKKFYKHYGVPDKKLFFCPYAVDNTRFMAANQELKIRKKELRKELGISNDDVAILFVGKFIEKKRPMDLLRAFELLNTKYKPRNTTHLVFVGDGELREKLERYTKKNNLDNVHFTGFKNQTELPKYYSISDIFVLPSGMGETWGLVVNEAMNFGLPVIISDMPGSGYDLVKEGKNGFKFPVDNINALTKKLEILAKDKEKRKEFGKKSLEIIQYYSCEQDVEGILNALAS